MRDVMSKDVDPLDKMMTVRVFLEVLEPYNAAIAGLGSCMIDVSAALRNSEIEELQVEGETVYKKLDAVIKDLELAHEKIKELVGQDSSDE
jgi:hypothetical protein